MGEWQSRTEKILGAENLKKLSKSHVLIAGLGGVGSWAAESLARSGVGRLTLIDFDTVTESNINRQLPALITTVGQLKVNVVSQRLAIINSNLELETMPVRINEENTAAIVGIKPDYIIDAIDSVMAKVALIEECIKQQVNIISSMGAGNRLLPGGFVVSDVSKTHSCPLARTVRLQLRKKGIDSGVKVVFNTQPAIKEFYTPETAPGSMVFAPAVCGLTLGAEVVNDLIHNIKSA